MWFLHVWFLHVWFLHVKNHHYNFPCLIFLHYNMCINFQAATRRRNYKKVNTELRRGSRGGKMGEFSPPFFWAPFFLSFSYPSNIEIKFDFSDFSDWGRENSPPISKSWIRTWQYPRNLAWFVVDISTTIFF